MQRNISGVYFRFQNPESERWENRVFEDLPKEKQREILDSKEPEFVKNMALIMAKKLKELADEFDIVSA